MITQKLRKALAIACIAFAPVAISHQVAFALPLPIADQPASSTANLELGELTSGVERYLVPTSSGVAFNTEAALAAGEHSQIIQAGQNFNRIQQAQNHDSSPQPAHASNSYSSEHYAQPQGIKIPVWGNWCGPGHSGPGTPVDTLDTLCMRHDKCYAQRGYLSCYCDAQLKAEIDRFSHRMGSKERAMAAAVKLAFMHPVCNPFS